MKNAEPNVNPTHSTADPLALGAESCLPLGTRLADFEITGLIGEGGFGIVYLAFDHSLQRTVAIKEYMPGALAGRGADKSVLVRSERHQATFDAGLKSFINEARLLARFDHPALVKVYRFWEQNKTGYMAMRHYHGETLKSVLKNDPARITEAWLKSVLKPMLEALDALYQVQILHRDISPDNIMIQHSGEAVLLDFGAARQIIGDITHALTVILKPGYAPIEQYAEDSAMTQGPWTDIYALSAVVYWAITKKPPPTSVGRIIQDPIELLQQGAYQGYSAAFLAAIDKGLAVKPADRPQSIEEFRTLLGIGPLTPPHAGPLAATAPPAARMAEASAGAHQPAPAKANLKQQHAAHMAGKKNRNETRPQPPTVRKPLQILALTGLLVVAAYGAYRYLGPAPAPSYAPAAQASVPLAATPAAVTPAPVAETAVSAADAAILGPSAPAQPQPDIKPLTAPAAPATPAVAGNGNAKAIGLVRLTVKPWGTILVDGEPKGVSPPLKRLRLPEGRHQIKIRNPNFPDHVIEVDVGKQKQRNIEYDFSPPSKTSTPR